MIHTYQIGLKLVLLRTQAGPLLLPEGVRLDDVSNVDDVGEELLEDFEDGLDRVPSGGAAAHVHNHRESQLPHVVAAKEKVFEM